jgi:hypothetical protein
VIVDPYMTLGVSMYVEQLFLISDLDGVASFTVQIETPGLITVSKGKMGMTIAWRSG